MNTNLLGPQDAAEVRALLDQCGLPTSDLAAAHPDLIGLRDSEGLMGVVGVEVLGSVGLLRSLAVRADLRGNGLGHGLTEAAEQWAATRGVRQLFLLTTTAAPFFAGRGYATVDRAMVPEPIRTTTEFAGLCPSTALVMRRHLVAGD